MKRHCIHSGKILEYLDGELSKSGNREFEIHLRSCHFCRQTLSEFRILKRNLDGRRRPRPGKAFLRQYHQDLASQFSRVDPQTLLTRIHLILPRPAVRLARVTVILLIGISLGWFLSRKTIPPNGSASSDLQLSNEAVRQISNYFLESEMWLLDVMNLSRNGDIDSDDWNLTREEAQQLLRKTIVIRELALGDNQILTGYFNDLEMLLMDLINSPDVDRSETLKQIKQTISDLNLQLRTGVLQAEMSVS